ncbi:hypothetical protein A7C91_03475 [Thermococcus piezophilus]|uniref:Uncharacterized protein n=1 Tax=Thermococcus piezophilus TaxID=1712654 RepID=A0A172WFY1_9EURY|nr:hypothetical protein A7C91_03475 [Thermococcus piezophilus]
MELLREVRTRNRPSREVRIHFAPEERILPASNLDELIRSAPAGRYATTVVKVFPPALALQGLWR